MIKHLFRSGFSLLIGLVVGLAVAAPALAYPTDTAAALQANAADLYASVAANAAELHANVGP